METIKNQHVHYPKPAPVYSYLEIMDVFTGETKTLAKVDGIIEAPNWHPDGRTLYYNERGRMVAFDIESRKARLLETGLCVHCNNDHVISPDGKRIAVSHMTAEDGRSRVYVMPIGGGTPTLVTPLAPSYLHGWSPDGTTFAYCAERDGEFDIYTLPVEGGVEKQLTFTPGLNDGSEFAPDGRIWFNSVRTGLMQIFRMNPDGTEQTQMTFEEDLNCWFAHVSPDGKTIVYIAYHKGDLEPGQHLANKHVLLRRMMSDGSGAVTIKELFGGQGTINVNSWAPDSRRIAYVRYELK